MAKVSRITAELWYAHYRNNHSLAETGRYFNVSRYTVKHFLDKYGLPLRTQKHGIYLARNVRDETMHMYREYKTGVTMPELAVKYHMSYSCVHRRFSEYGLARRRGGPRSKAAA